MIIFGLRSLKLASYKPSEFDLPESIDHQFTIERRQRYFHFFWIPTFNVGQIWAIRHKNNKLSIPDDDMLKVIVNAEKPKHKTPWYTYSGLLLILFVGLGFGTYVFAEKMYRENNYKNTFEAHLNQLKEDIPKLKADYCLKMYDTERIEYYFKVINTQNDNLICVKSNKSNYGAINPMIDAFIPDDVTIFDTVVIAKASLNNIYWTEMENYNFVGKQIYKDGPPLQLLEIALLDFPDFQLVDMEYADGKFTARIKNVGASTKLEDCIIDNSEYPGAEVNLLNPIFPAKNLEKDSVWILKGTYKGNQPAVNFKFKTKSRNNTERRYLGRIFSKDVHFYDITNAD